jgi:hypothetical protein
LKDALFASSNDTKSGGCIAGEGVDTIVLPANGDYFIPIKTNGKYKPDHDVAMPPIKSTVIIQGYSSGFNIQPTEKKPIPRLGAEARKNLA